MKIWLDDIRDPPDDDWIVCRSGEEVLALLAQVGLENVTCISFDNDLGYTSIEGYQVLDKIEEMVYLQKLKKSPALFVHSANTVATSRMNVTIDRIYAMTACLD